MLCSTANPDVTLWPHMPGEGRCPAPKPCQAVMQLQHPYINTQRAVEAVRVPVWQQ